MNIQGDDGGDGEDVVLDARDGWMEVPNADDEHYDKKASALWDRLGRPKDAKAYDFGEDPKDFVFSDADKEYRESFKPIAHRLGLTARQAKGLAEWQIAQAKLARDAEKAGFDEGGKRARAQFEKEWGREFKDRVAKAGATPEPWPR
jgi:hypothetical protein